MATFWWLFHKELLCEYRSWKTWPPMLLLSMIATLVVGVQWKEQGGAAESLVAGLLWTVMLFAGGYTTYRSLSSEREDGCWSVLMQYPIAPSAIYGAKLLANAVLLGALLVVLIPLFQILCGVDLLIAPVPTAAVGLLGTAGIAAVGTLIAGSAPRTGENTGGAMLLGIPLAIPIVLAASSAMRLILVPGAPGEWWYWMRLLIVCDAVFAAIGMLLFGLLVED